MEHIGKAIFAGFVLALLLLVSSAGAASSAYVTRDGNQVFVVDTMTDTVTSQIEVGVSSWWAVATPDGKKVYVSTSNDISVIDTAANAVTKTIPTGAMTRPVMSRDGRYVYVANGGSVDAIDTATDGVRTVVELNNVNYVSVSPDGGTLYVSYTDESYQGQVAVVDAATGSIATTYAVGAGAVGSVVTPDGRKLYMAQDQVIGVIDLNSGAIRQINTGVVSYMLTLSPAGDKVYAGADGKVIVIDTASDTIVAESAAYPGGYPSGIAITGDGDKLYVSVGTTVQVIDTGNDQVIGQIEMGHDAGGIAIAAVSSGPTPVVPIKITSFTATPKNGRAPFDVNMDVQIAGTPARYVLVGYFNGIKTGQTEGTTIASWTEHVNGDTRPGVYRGTLQVWDAAGNTDTKAATFTVLPPLPPVAQFTASVVTGKAPLSVQFTDQSTNGPTEWRWVFGDGATSTVQNPTHTYAKAGTYNVVLVAKNAGGADQEVKSRYITVTGPVAAPIKITSFTATPKNGRAPFDVNMDVQIAGTPARYVLVGYFNGIKTGQTEGTTIASWTEHVNGDTRPGVYRGTLQVWDAAGNTDTKAATFTVLPPLPPVAQFTASVVTGKAPLSVQFTDQSTNGPTGWKWVFGDGATSTAQNPTHTYTKAGTYTVALVVKNAGGADLEMKKAYIVVTGTAPRPPRLNR